MLWAFIAVSVALLISWIFGICAFRRIDRILTGLIYYMDDHNLPFPTPEELYELVNNVEFKRVKGSKK